MTAKDSNRLFKKLLFTGVALCMACCLFAFVGAMFWNGRFTGFLQWATDPL
jgi:hypothetical protein